MRTVRLLACLCAALVPAAAWAGTAYISFDGDDGSGSSLPAGVTVGSDGWGAVQLSGDRATLQGGGDYIDFPAAWLEGSVVRLEYTIQDLGAFLADTAAGYVDGFFANGDGCMYFGAVGDHPVTGTSHVGPFECGGGPPAPQYSTDLNTLTGTERATVRAVLHTGGVVSVYVALDGGATTASGRAREEDFIFAGKHGWGSFKNNAHTFRFQTWGKAITVDDLIIEGPSVPDVGTAPAMGGMGAGTMYLNIDGDDGAGSSLAGSIVGWDDNVSFSDGALRIGPNSWGAGSNLTFGMLPRGPFSLEFTIQNPAEVAGFNQQWGWVLALQIESLAGDCLYPLGLFDGIGWEAGDTPEVAVASCGAQADSLTQALTASTRATLKMVADPDANTLDLYAAFDDDATTPTERASNFIHIDTYPWGSWAYGPAAMRLVGYSAGSTGPSGAAIIDDIILEGAGIPDFGPTPPGLTVTVPDVRGLTLALAEETLTSAGFVVGTVAEVESSQVPAGSVISQNPAAGAAAEEGAVVNLVVSLGAPTVTVPLGGAAVLLVLGGTLAGAGALRLRRRRQA